MAEIAAQLRRAFQSGACLRVDCGVRRWLWRKGNFEPLCGGFGDVAGTWQVRLQIHLGGSEQSGAVANR